MRYFIDTEFSAPGAFSPIDLISIGILSEDGREFYRENSETPFLDVSEWVEDNVLPHLVMYTSPETAFSEGPATSLSQIRNELRAFIGDDSSPEFWGYYCAYDYVVLSQLMGGMEGWPEGWPYYMHDLRQALDAIDSPNITQDGDSPHNALQDARWVCRMHQLYFADERESAS